MYETFGLKEKAKRRLRHSCVFSVLPMTLGIFLTWAQPVLAEAIRSFDSSVMLAKDGHLVVEEKITYDFEGESRHGIERFIPVKASLLGQKQRINIEVKSASDNLSNKFSVYESNGYKVIKIGSPDRKVTGVQTYDINYKVDGAFAQAAQTGSPASLSWPVTGDKWKVPINHASVMVYADDKSMLPAAKISAQYGSDSGFHKAKKEVTSNSTILEASNLQPGQGFNLSVSFPGGIIAQTNEIQRGLWQFGSIFSLGGGAFLNIPGPKLAMILLGLGVLIISLFGRMIFGSTGRSPYYNRYDNDLYYRSSAYDSSSSDFGGGGYSGGGDSGSGDGGGSSW